MSVASVAMEVNSNSNSNAFVYGDGYCTTSYEGRKEGIERLIWPHRNESLVGFAMQVLHSKPT